MRKRVEYVKRAVAANSEQKYICFELRGETYGIPASHLIGVSENCPRTSYYGLPEGVSEITYWKGRLYVVRSLSRAGDIYLFTRAQAGSYSIELALRVPGRVSVRFNDGSFTVMNMTSRVERAA